jgi:hypothetical protein
VQAAFAKNNIKLATLPSIGSETMQKPVVLAFLIRFCAYCGKPHQRNCSNIKQIASLFSLTPCPTDLVIAIRRRRRSNLLTTVNPNFAWCGISNSCPACYGFTIRYNPVKSTFSFKRIKIFFHIYSCGRVIFRVAGGDCKSLVCGARIC